MSQISKIHLIGGYGIPEILKYQETRSSPHWNYPLFFPFWEILPGVPVVAEDACEPDKDALLLVVNLNEKVWEQLAPRFSLYRQRVLVQTEGQIGWEKAYELAPQFDLFLNFDPTYQYLPGYVPVIIPYEPTYGSSHRDQRGWQAWAAQWRHSRRMFLSIYGMRFFPRKQKAVLIATLNPRDHYQIRLRAVSEWKQFVDVYGRGWPSDMPNYRGVCMSKMDVFRRYKFALVLENQRQPGYVTEKFLDCLLAGIVPIYWGDPTLESRLPATMLYPISDENDTIEPIIRDREGYRQRRAAILAYRDQILANYSTRRFINILHDALQRYA